MMVIAATACLVVGIGLSVWWSDFHWLARCGTLIIAVGVCSVARPAIVGRELLVPVKMDESGLMSNDPGYYIKAGLDVPESVAIDSKSRYARDFLGPVLTLVGTITSGFADLLNRVI
jgi:hypothetical protein